jgi:hypothetical protein
MQLIIGSHSWGRILGSHSEDMSANLPSRRGIPMPPEKIEVASSI